MRIVALIVALTACQTSTPAETPEPASAPAATAPAAAPGAVGAVAVPRDGKRFDPPVAKAEMPEGAWYCDMGTVHYARMTKGDGGCPVCGMELSHKGEDVPADGAVGDEAGEAMGHEGHDGHEGH